MATQTLSGLIHKRISVTSSGAVDFVDVASDWCDSGGDAFASANDYAVVSVAGTGAGYGYAHTRTTSGFTAHVISSPATYLIIPVHPPIVEHLE